MTTEIKFPQDFLWGSATAAYQIEGATDEDERGASIWDTFCDMPGTIADNSSGDVACDHYHRYREDVALMAQLGLKGYRFSIAWPRILPEGRGKVNQAGLDFYSRLVDSLLEYGVTPFATLYHWDLPQALQDKGGWPERSTVDAFIEYTDAISRHLSDRIHHWMTINEPWVVAFLGYGIGMHAPGINDRKAYLRTSHHLLLAHGRAVGVLRANGDSRTKVGIANAYNWADSLTDSLEDIAAARRFDGFFNRWFLDPIYKGEYPPDMVEILGRENLPVEDGDLQTIAAPTDFLGLNYYTRSIISHNSSFGELSETLHMQQNMNESAEHTEMGWEVYPTGMYKMLTTVHQNYAPKAIYITENGTAFPDEVTADGQVHDDRRVAYLQSHFVQANHAIQEGVPLNGYFVWSLMDNFEWGFGYTKRFGVIYVDYSTQQRIVKDSGKWYANVIKHNQLALAEA
jgi:beta-glucosidase